MRTLILVIVAAFAVGAGPGARAAELETQLVSAGRDGSSSGTNSELGAISGSGRYVVWTSKSSHVVRGDTNGSRDVFVWDRSTGKSVRVNVSSEGEQTGPGGCGCHIGSYATGISADGRFVSFYTKSPTLVPGDDGSSDGFVHDMRTGETTLVTPRGDKPGWSYPAGISPDGRFVVFYSFMSRDRETKWFVFDRETEERSRIDGATAGHPAFTGSVLDISEGGAQILFVSDDAALRDDTFPNDPVYTPGTQAYVLDRAADTIEQVSVSSDEQGGNNSVEGARMSSDGRYVVFDSTGTNLAPEDSDAQQDIFLRDRVEGTTTLVSVPSSGSSTAILGADGWSWVGDISDDGCRAVFSSEAPNLVEGDANGVEDIFVRDVCAGGTTRVSVAGDGSEANRASYESLISGDGAWAAWQTRATNLSPADGDARWDVLVRGPLG